MGMLKGIGDDQERKCLLLCLRAGPPEGFVTGNLCQVQTWSRASLEGWALPAGEHVGSVCSGSFVFRLNESQFPFVPRCTSMKTLEGLTADCHFCTIRLSVGFESAAVGERKGEAGGPEDPESSCHTSLSSNPVFIAPASREVMGVSSGRRGSFRQTAGGLSGDLSRSGHRDTWRPLAAGTEQGRVRGAGVRLMARLHSCHISCQRAPGTESILVQATINLGPLGFIPRLHRPEPYNLCLQLPN